MRNGALECTALILNSIKPTQLEKVAINDALPLKAARRDAIAKLKFLGASNLSCIQSECRFIIAQAAMLARY